MRFKSFLGAAGLFLCSLAARADSLSPSFSFPMSSVYTYSLQGTFASGATLNGTFDVQFFADRDIFSNVEAFVQNGTTRTNYVNSVPQSEKYISSLGAESTSGSQLLDLYFFYYPVEYLFGSPDPGSYFVADSVNLCVRSARCRDAGQPGDAGLHSSGVYDNPYGIAPLQDELFSGKAVLVTTPEPSSFALLGTGVLGLMGIWRRRLAEAD